MLVRFISFPSLHSAAFFVARPGVTILFIYFFTCVHNFNNAQIFTIHSFINWLKLTPNDIYLEKRKSICTVTHTQYYIWMDSVISFFPSISCVCAGECAIFSIVFSMPLHLVINLVCVFRSFFFSLSTAVCFCYDSISFIYFSLFDPLSSLSIASLMEDNT